VDVLQTRDRMPDRLKSVTAKVDAALTMSKSGGHSLFSTARDKGTSADLDEAATRRYAHSIAVAEACARKHTP
jgi:hypothetical protein